MKKTYSSLTLGKSVVALVAFCLMVCIGLLALMLVDTAASIPSSHVHQYQHADGEISRVVDPWRPLPGCLILQSDAGKVVWPLDGKNGYNPGMAALCGEKGPALQAGVVPADLNQVLLAVNNQWRAPLVRKASFPMNSVNQDGLEITQGAHIELTLNAIGQAMVQSLAECMTGHEAACGKVGLSESEWLQNSESAAARSLGVVVVDVKTGAIDVLASAHSACFQAEFSGKPLPEHCPKPALIRDKPLQGKLDNHALNGAKPGSLVKPVMVAAFLRDPVLGRSLRQKNSVARKALLEDIKNSDTEHFLDRAYCRDHNFMPCQRLGMIAATANDLGWNTEASNLFALDGEPEIDQTVAQVKPHFMQSADKDGQWQDMDLNYDANEARRCALEQHWEKCRGEVANSASELMGQGNAYSSPLAIADMFKRIARAANGEHEHRPLHLIESVHGKVNGREKHLVSDLTPQSLHISQEEANLILEGMSLTHQGGTATSGCVKAFDKNINECKKLVGVAGKTGTPAFSDEKYTWQQRADICGEIQQRQKKLREMNLTAEQRRQLNAERSHCVQSPIKWYAAVLRDDPRNTTGAWSKVVVVLAERNYRRDGWIDSKNDMGTPNIAAELGFRLIKLRSKVEKEIGQ